MTRTDDFERSIGYTFRDRDLFGEALTHASYANENGCPRSNERLEFLGDAVLGLCVSERLYAEHVELNEGGLSKARARVVREATLASWAIATRLPDLLMLGRGMEAQGGRRNPSILADAMEAIFGAVFLDGGYEASRDVVANLVKIEDGMSVVRKYDRDKDAKSLLQEVLQARGEKPPVYRLTSRTGPDHAAVFEVEATLEDGHVIGAGRGNSIKTAEFSAARTALLAIVRLKERPISEKG
jgi:ribonuclease-3